MIGFLSRHLFSSLFHLSCFQAPRPDRVHQAGMILFVQLGIGNTKIGQHIFKDRAPAPVTGKDGRIITMIVPGHSGRNRRKSSSRATLMIPPISIGMLV